MPCSPIVPNTFPVFVSQSKYRMRANQTKKSVFSAPVLNNKVVLPSAKCFVSRLNVQQKRTTVEVQAVSTSPAPSGAVTNGNRVPSSKFRLALPSKGRMAEDTLSLLADCQLKVKKPNERQYVAAIKTMPEVEVWFQRASDVVRRIRHGDVDLGIVGFDMFTEYGDSDPDLIVLHDALDFGHCYLALGVPSHGRYEDINSLDALRNMGWTKEKPLRVVTGYQNVARNFFAKSGFPHVELLSADGALEAAPAMGYADIILDLVSTGTTLRENNLKQIEGGRIMDSQGVLVASRTALKTHPGLMKVVKELLERLEAHLTAENYYSVIANFVGQTPEDIASKLLAAPGLQGLAGPTISPVYTRPSEGHGTPVAGTYAATICVKKGVIYDAVKSIRSVGGSGVLVQPMTYIFDEEPQRWKKLLEELGMSNQ